MRSHPRNSSTSGQLQKVLQHSSNLCHSVAALTPWSLSWARRRPWTRTSFTFFSTGYQWTMCSHTRGLLQLPAACVSVCVQEASRVCGVHSVVTRRLHCIMHVWTAWYLSVRAKAYCPEKPVRSAHYARRNGIGWASPHSPQTPPRTSVSSPQRGERGPRKTGTTCPSEISKNEKKNR